MINHKYECIFVEVPKTASTSIRSVVGAAKKPHLDIMQIKDMMDVDKFDKYFKFGFVRNPWDRAWSLYRNRRNRHGKSSFEAFIKWHNYATDACINPTQKKYQLDFLTDESGNVVVDYIGKFENLQKDFDIICDKIGIPRRKLPHMNKTGQKNYTKFYNNEMREIIAQRFIKDIEYFEYEFGK
tara:strand:+ start:328 stop:876 length:549 start_codon:yes stop_codon:yes gene_type:complete